eukprot:gb/GECH01006001.1/.p1 GENE.gb/GECH01006001.1/~~gb/GECH01006001.1/.p1  ORF type:complete len:405 (+),score=151.43 gb/GECH01006001.1/:1-1215(+)
MNDISLTSSSSLSSIGTEEPLNEDAVKQEILARLPSFSNSHQIDSHLIRQTPEYGVAWELELWREEEKKKFRNFLKQKEEEILNEYDEKQRQKEIENEKEFTEQKQVLDKLEDRLKKALDSIRKRDSKLRDVEKELTRRREDLEREFEYKTQNTKDRLRRVQEEATHKLNLEKKKYSQLEKENQDLHKKIQDNQKEYEELESRFAQYKRQVSEMNETQLQAEISTAKIQYAELEGRYDSLEKSKTKYKQYCKQLQQELDDKKKEMSEYSRQISWDHITGADRHQFYQPSKPSNWMELEDMKMELYGLLKQENEKYHSSDNDFEDVEITEDSSEEESHGSDVSPKYSRSHISSSQQTTLGNPTYPPSPELQRLLKEKKNLLRTGVYTEDDVIIQELDAQIKNYSN